MKTRLFTNKVNKKVKLPAFHKYLSKRAGQKIVIRTLGRQKQILFYLEKRPRIICQNSKGNLCDITRLFKKVLDRYKQLKKKSQKNARGKPLYLATGNYAPKRWAKAPDRNFAPYIAAAIAYLDKKL